MFMIAYVASPDMKKEENILLKKMVDEFVDSTKEGEILTLDDFNEDIFD